jgi:phage terminase large subunit-like protein
LYEQGKVRHVGLFPELEEELCGFSTFGYTGTGSPNRADALVWALTELFPGMTKPQNTDKTEEETDYGAMYGGSGWMAA